MATRRGTALLPPIILGALLTACGGSSGGGSAIPAATAPEITVSPASRSVLPGQAATFSVTATGSVPLSYQWQRNGQNITGATTVTYVTPPTTLADDGTTFVVVVTNSAGVATSGPAKLTVAPAVVGTTDVLTYHNDNLRTAQNLTETLLTPASVASAKFGLLRQLGTDGRVDGQPLIASNLNVGGRARDVLYVVTEHGTVYVYDADDGTALAQVSVLGSGETPSDSRGCDQVTPEIGITSTPVIDRSAGTHGTLFVVAMSKDGAGKYHQRLHALDLTTLAEQSGSPVTIQATYPGSGANSANGAVVFDPGQYKERAALLLQGGVVYTAWASHCDIDPYTGWVIGYDEATLAATRVLNLVPNGSQGAIWQSGGGLAADAAGSVYALIGNGTFETTLDANGFPVNRDFGNAFVRLSATNPIQVADYFTESNAISESAADVDLGSGAPMLLPDLSDSSGAIHHLAVGAGKDGHLYVVNRDAMGKFHSAASGIYQDLPNALPGGIWSAPAYFSNTVYYADVSGTLKAFPIANARLASTPGSQTSMTFAYPGASPSVSANGSSNGIVWALESNAGQHAVLHAFDAGNLANELYNSDQAAGGRDHFGNGNKFVTPTIANGKVYVGTPTGVAAFGALP
jgi:hypothetical protein